MCTQDKGEGEGHSGWVCGAPWRERDQGSPEDWLSLPAKQTAFTMAHAQDGTGLSVQCVCLTAAIPLTVPTGPHVPLGPSLFGPAASPLASRLGCEQVSRESVPPSA